MGTLYNRIKKLCDDARITPGKMCNDLGLSRNTVTALRTGRATTMKLEKAGKIADYFGVSVDYLLGKTDEKEKAPAKEQEPSDDDIQFALFGEHSEITEAIYEDVKSYARFKMEEAKRKK